MLTASVLSEFLEQGGFKQAPKFVKTLVETGLELLALFALFFFLRWVLGSIVDRMTGAVAARDEAAGNEGRAARLRTLASLIKSILFYTLALMLFIAGLGTLGFDVRGVLGTAGVAGLAVGFGAQKLVRDVISGFFLLLEDQYAVGDYVTIGGVTGTVEELGMRISRLRDDEGRLYILANGDINQVCNMSRGPLVGTLDVAIAASAETARATEVLDNAFAESGRKRDLGLEEPARVEGISAADATKTVLRIRFRADEGQRPADVALRLREIARAALLRAEIPLG